MLQSPTPHMREALPGEPPRTRNARPSRRLIHFRGHQHLAIAVRLHRRYEPRLLHLLDETCRAVVSDPQMALNERDRCAPRAHHDLDRLIVKRIGFSTLFAEAQLGSAVGFVAFEEASHVFGASQRFEIGDDLVHFLIGDVGTVHTLRHSRSEERRVGKECRWWWWA